MPTIRPAIKAALIGCFWFMFLTAYFERVPLPGFTGYAGDIFWASLVVACACGLGYGLTQRWLAPDWRPLETFVFSMGAGLGALSLLMTALGLIGGWRTTVVRWIVGLGSISGLYLLR